MKLSRTSIPERLTSQQIIEMTGLELAALLVAVALVGAAVGMLTGF